jgi:hypothetical protein
MARLAQAFSDDVVAHAVCLRQIGGHRGGLRIHKRSRRSGRVLEHIGDRGRRGKDLPFLLGALVLIGR